MDKLFGIPINTFMVQLLVILAIGMVILAVTAWRNPVLLKMGIRNIARRKAQTSLIILGLMLTTLLFSSALVTGDTMKHSIDNEALRSLGTVDEVITDEGDGNQGAASMSGVKTRSGDNYFDIDVVNKVSGELAGSGLTDGVTPIIMEQAPVVSMATKQSIPELDVLGVEDDYTAATEPLLTESGQEIDPAGLSGGQAFISSKAADDLSVSKGDSIQVFLGPEPMALEVADVYTEGGKPSGARLSLVLPAADVQEHMGSLGRYNTILISNTGDEFTGVDFSDQVKEKVDPLLAGTDLEIAGVKKDTLEQADQAASTFTSIFLLFGEFSMIAGVLLIFLIFVMLAAERKQELGVMRALGSKRRDILKVFAFEGMIYSILAAAVGVFAGIAVGWGMVKILARAFGSFDDFTISFDVGWRSLVIAYSMGMIATFIVVVISAWRTGHINIVRAIRDLPEPKRRRRKMWVAGSIVMIALGALLIVSGLNSLAWAPFMIGISLITIGLPLLLRNFGLPERAAFTIAGLGLLFWWMLPGDTMQSLLSLPDMTMGMEMFILSGVAIVAGSIWTVMYNSDILLMLVVNAFRRFKGMPPLLTMAVNYPMRSRFRTGMALAMFALIIFTMSFMSTMLESINQIWEDTEKISGGYEIQGSTGYANPVGDVMETISTSDEGVDPADIEATGAISVAPVEVKQTGEDGGDWVNYFIQGADDGYLRSTDYGFLLKSDEYESDADVWRALAEDPSLAVVHGNLVPTEADFDVGSEVPDFMLSGLFREDETLPDVFIEARNPETGKTEELKVIGIIDSMALYATNSIFVSQNTIDRLSPAPVLPTSYWFKLRPGTDAESTSKALSRVFFENGMDTKVTATDIDEMMRSNLTMNRLMQGFMGLGLVVGIAALGVIAARSVVERRHQIGMLRAIGFRSMMVQNSFLLESSFVALLGIIIGAVLGTALCYNVMNTMSDDFEGVSFKISWSGILLIFVLAYGASLLTTYLPARQASKIYPAEALRYE